MKVTICNNARQYFARFCNTVAFGSIVHRDDRYEETERLSQTAKSFKYESIGGTIIGSMNGMQALSFV